MSGAKQKVVITQVDGRVQFLVFDIVGQRAKNMKCAKYNPTPAGPNNT